MNIKLDSTIPPFHPGDTVRLRCGGPEVYLVLDNTKASKLFDNLAGELTPVTYMANLRKGTIEWDFTKNLVQVSPLQVPVTFA
jgi:hypothetical protein